MTLSVTPQLDLWHPASGSCPFSASSSHQAPRRPDYQLGNQGLPGLSCALSCEAGCPRATVRYRFSPGLMARILKATPRKLRKSRGKAEAGRLMMAALVRGGNQLSGQFKTASKLLGDGRPNKYKLAADNWADELAAKFQSTANEPPPHVAAMRMGRVSRSLHHFLIHGDMAIEDGPWLGVHPKWAWVYMCVLAEQVAKHSNLSPVTDQILAHAETNGWTPEQITRALIEEPFKYSAGQELEAVIGMLAVQLVVPAGVAHIPVQKIIDIRQRHHADFDAFHDVITTVAAELRDEFTNISERAVLEAVLEAYLAQVVKSRFDQPLADVRKAFKGLGIDTTIAALNMKCALPAVVVAAGGIAAHQPIIAGTGAAAIGVLALARTARLNWAERARPSAASYLWRIEHKISPKTLIRSISRPEGRQNYR